ncbi:MAG: site-specific integrase [Treponema sp.]|nr:site-specific integrase [Treponema sp.]
MALKKIGTNKWRINVSWMDKTKGYPVGKQATFTGTRSEATIKEAELLKELKAQCSLTASSPYANTFKDLVELYRENTKLRGRCSSSQDRMLTFLSRELGHLRIETFAEFFDKYIQNLQSSVSVRGTLRSPGTINFYIAITKAIFWLAVKRDIIVKNPISQSRFPLFNVRPRDRVLKDEEWHNLVNVISVNKPQILPIVKFMSMIPCRTMELVGAKREQYDPDSRTIYIPDSKAKVPIYKPVPEELYGYFDSLPQDCPYLFYREYPNDMKYYPLTTLRDAWDFCCRKAGISNYRVHDLRHWAVTKLIMAGNTEQDIADIAGWTSPAMLRVYYHKDIFRSAKRIQIPKFSVGLSQEPLRQTA